MTSPRPRRKAATPPPPPLPIGTHVGDYEVRNILGSGTFGIVYRVVDALGEHELAVKEYLPGDLARRDGPVTVVPIGPEQVESFEMGMRFFVNEGELMRKFEHPALLRIYGAWKQNGTAYMAMDLVTGRSLVDTMRSRWKSPRESELRALLDDLLGALEGMHKAGVQHRDINPRSVLIDPKGRPLLMDLDSPRRVMTARGATGPVGPRDGFAGIELYGTGHEHARGPWTDLYALGALLHYMIVGKPPKPAPQRQAGERLAPGLLRPDLRHSLDFLAVVDWMLAPQPKDRPQSVAEVREALRGDGLPQAWRPTRRERWAVRLRRRRPLLVGAVVLVVLGVVGLGVNYLRHHPELLARILPAPE